MCVCLCLRVGADHTSSSSFITTKRRSISTQQKLARTPLPTKLNTTMRSQVGKQQKRLLPLGSHILQYHGKRMILIGKRILTRYYWRRERIFALFLSDWKASTGHRPNTNSRAVYFIFCCVILLVRNMGHHYYSNPCCKIHTHQTPRWSFLTTTSSHTQSTLVVEKVDTTTTTNNNDESKRSRRRRNSGFYSLLPFVVYIQWRGVFFPIIGCWSRHGYGNAIGFVL